MLFVSREQILDFRLYAIGGAFVWLVAFLSLGGIG